MDIVKNNKQYPKQLVDQARTILQQAKQQGSTTILGDIKGLAGEVIHHPYEVSKQLVAGAITSPVLTAATMGVGKAAEGISSKIFGPAITRGLSLAGRSAEEAKFANALSKLTAATRLESIDPNVGNIIRGTATRAAAREA